jgi:hypothetical protein
MLSQDRDPEESPHESTRSSSQSGGVVVFERLPHRRRPPASLAVVIMSIVALLIWAPWRQDPANRTASAAPAGGRASGSALAIREPVRPTSSPDSSGAPIVAGRARYESITDNEWTVVALLTPSDGGSTDEPANQHENWPATTANGPFVVLQQGVVAGGQPVERPARPATACATSGSRDQAAVHLPRARVVYLGVTFPGMDPRAEVAVSDLTGSATRFTKAGPVVAELAGMRVGWEYTVPTTGPGGTILFVTSPAGLWASGPYRFEVRTPASDSAKFVYACVGL